MNDRLTYPTYADAVNYLLQRKDLSQKWLAERIQKEEKLRSLQSQISRWIRQGDPISEGYRNRINKALSVRIIKGNDGHWRIFPPASTRRQAQEIIDQIESLLHDLKQII